MRLLEDLDKVAGEVHRLVGSDEGDAQHKVAAMAPRRARELREHYLLMSII
jgi:hypothetical protein